MRVLGATCVGHETTFTVSMLKAIPRARVSASLVGRPGRFSSLRCGDSTLTPSSATPGWAWIEEWACLP